MPGIVNCPRLEGKLDGESGAQGLTFRTVFAREAGFQMPVTYNDIAPGGKSKSHSHPDEHIVFVVKGAGKLFCGDSGYDISEGTAIYLASDEPHCFHNTGKETLVTFGIRGPLP